MKTKQKIKTGCLSLIDFTGDNKDKNNKKKKKQENKKPPSNIYFCDVSRYVCFGESCLFIQGRNNV